jgi:hypothetical protein
MADLKYIYYDMKTDNAYRADGSQIANDNVPEFPYKSQRKIYFQLLNSFTTALTDVYTRLASVTVTGSAAIDNDAIHYEDGFKFRNWVPETIPI